MTSARLHWLRYAQGAAARLFRLRRFWLYNPWTVDRWLEELAVECDEDQWARARRVLPLLL